MKYQHQYNEGRSAFFFYEPPQACPYADPGPRCAWMAGYWDAETDLYGFRPNRVDQIIRLG